MEQFNFIVTTDVYWPNGLSLNRENERFYWIDAYLDKMESIFYNGTGRKLLIQEGFISIRTMSFITRATCSGQACSTTPCMHQAQLKNDTVVNQMILRDEIFGPCQFHINCRPLHTTPWRYHYN